MRRETKKIIKLTSIELLLALVDFSAEVFLKNNPFYYDLIIDYLKKRKIDRINFKNKIYYLKRQGYIRTYIKGKKKYFELTKKGREKIKDQSFHEIKIRRPKKWDGNWRVVIFDIPKKYDRERDVFRHKLENLGFIRIQKSVYLNPFKCTQEIEEITDRLRIKKYILIMVSEIIQSERKIIGRFLNKGILVKNDLKRINLSKRN